MQLKCISRSPVSREPLTCSECGNPIRHKTYIEYSETPDQPYPLHLTCYYRLRRWKLIP